MTYLETCAQFIGQLRNRFHFVAFASFHLDAGDAYRETHIARNLRYLSMTVLTRRAWDEGGVNVVVVRFGCALCAGGHAHVSRVEHEGFAS